MKKLFLLLLFIAGCDLVGQIFPLRNPKLLFNDTENVKTQLRYEVQTWIGLDTLGTKIYTLFDYIPAQVGVISYMDTVNWNSRWIKCRVRAVYQDTLFSDWSYTRFYRYTEFWPTTVENPKLQK